MKAQSELIRGDATFMRSKGFRGIVLTHVNKGKKYPYNSTKRGFGLSYGAKLNATVVVDEYRNKK